MNITELIVGDTLQFDTDVPAYPASDGYTLEAPVMVRQSKPMAMAIMALIPTMNVSDGS